MIKSRKNLPVLLILTLALIALAMSVVALDGKEELRAKMEAQRVALTVTSARSADQPVLKAAQADRPSTSVMSPGHEAIQAALAAKAAGQGDEMARDAAGDKKGHAGVSSANAAPDKQPYEGRPNTPRPDNRRVGGDNIGSAVAIPSVPYTDAGSTSGFADDYDEICPYDAPGSPDVVYSYTPTADEALTISLCDDATNYDTKLYVYENAVGTVAGCNDDWCSTVSYPSPYVSEVQCVSVTAGNTYYIVVDGYGGAFGDYVMHVSICEPCVVECPPGGTDEGEPCIGDDEEDYTNGGCNSVPPVFGSIDCDETVCGEWNTYLYGGSSYRDTDWYTFTLIDYSLVTITAEGEFPIVTGFLEQVVPGGGWDCGNFTGYIAPYATGNACDVVIVSQIMAPGDYAIFVGGTVFSGYDCASGTYDYTISVTCDPITEGACCYEDGSCVPDMEEAPCFTSGGTSWLGGVGCDPNLCPQPGPENDACADATPIGEVVDLPFCTDAANYDGPSSCQTAPNIWYCYTAGETGNATISLCGSGYDTYLGVYQGCECIGPVIVCNDDFCGLQSQAEIPVTAGSQYLIEIGGYSSNVGCGILNIWVSPPCVVECPPGSSDEGEDCGDDTNGGCNSVPPVFGSISCGETVCGNAWFDGSTRDTDWYQLTLTEWVSATWTVTAEFDVLAGLVEQDPPGMGDCAYSTGYLNPSAVGADCEEITVSVILGPGTHWFFVAPQFTSIYPCPGPWDYVASLTCVPITEGACCYEDGSCVPGMTEGDCYASDGLDWFGGVSCDPDPCPCYYDCPPGATPEGEVCLEDEAIDDTNGGCNSVPNVFGSLSCGETICGEWSTYLFGGSQYRDTDWYQLELDNWYTVTLNAEGGFPLVFGFIEQIVPGVPGCDNITGYIAPYALADPCTPTSIEVTLGPGTYYVFVGGQVFSGYPCAAGPWQYEITATCVPAEETYCDAGGSVEDEYIERVQVGTIDNSSGWTGYSDYTSLCTDMAPETGYPITITIGNAYSADTGAVWVDWNQDLDFDDPGELQPLTVGHGYGPYTGTVTPPVDALVGETRMRIRLTYNTTPTPCGTNTYGEVEDYCIMVGGEVPPTCAFAPDPTLTLTKFALNYVEGAVYFTAAAIGGGDLNEVELDYLQPQGSVCTVPFDDYVVVPEGYGDLPGPVGKGTFDLRAYVLCEEENGLVWGPVESFFDVYYELDMTPGSFGCSVDLIGHIPGDMNLNGTVNIADLTLLVNYLFRGGPAPQVMQVADVNGSGGTPNISDLTYFVDFLFRGGPTPRHQ